MERRDPDKSYDPTAEGALTFMHPFDAKLNEDNPRTISDERLTALKYAMEKAPSMLLARPVILDTDGIAVGGNMRLRASKEMIGSDEYPIFNAWVREHHGIAFFIRQFKSAAERREWILRDNQPYGEYVPDELAALVAAHKDEGADLALLGFAEPELDKLIGLDDAGSGDDGGGGGVDPLPDVWGVVVECENEAQQGELLEDLNRRGFQCRALL